MSQSDTLLRAASDLPRPELRRAAGADSGAAGEERYGQDHDHQHPERLPETPQRRMPHLRAGGAEPRSRAAAQYRPADRGTRAVPVHDHRTDREVLLGLLPRLAPRRLLRVDAQAESRTRAADFAHVVRPAFAGGAGADSGAESRTARARRLLAGARSGLSPAIRRLPARICPRRVENRLSDLAYHSGYGAPGRRLYHHGLRQHPDAAPRRGAAGRSAALRLHRARGLRDSRRGLTANLPPSK